MDDRQGWATNLKEEEGKERMKTKTFHVTKIHTSQRHLPLIDTKGKYNVSFVIIIVLGQAFPIYARQGYNIFAYIKPFLPKRHKLLQACPSKLGAIL